MRLSEICQKTETNCPEHLKNIDVQGITSNSKRVKQGFIFVCLEGTKNDGHRYINDALLHGASAVIIEKEAFSCLSEEEQADFTAKRLKAKGQYKRKQNEECLESYTSLKEEYGLVICDYYIAKVMFRMGMFSQSKEKFLSYLEQGGVKTEKAYMFLAKIERIKKNKGEAKRYVSKMHKIHRIFPRDFEYLSDKQYSKKKRLKVEDDKYDQHDDVKRKKSHNIRMSEDDFRNDDELGVVDFYDTDTDGKLSIIKGLLRSGEVKAANKLFNEVQRECAPEERGKVKQFDRNRKIYKNQKRSN